MVLATRTSGYGDDFLEPPPDPRLPLEWIAVMNEWGIQPANHRASRLRKSMNLGITKSRGRIEFRERISELDGAIGVSERELFIRGGTGDRRIHRDLVLTNKSECQYEGHYLSPDESSVLISYSCSEEWGDITTHFVGSAL